MQYKQVKRILDIFISTILLILLLPLFCLISILIAISDKGLVFATDPKRLGYGGKEFTMMKFRTMIPNAHIEITTNPKYKNLKKKWSKNNHKLKIEEDTRITWIGKILRKTDLDELPQLLNVIKGDMSLVGPRPTYLYEIEEHLEKYPHDKKYLGKIFMITPGITGIWQISGRNEIDFHKKLKLEAEYIKNMSFINDIKILLKTPIIVITRKGAYE